MISWGSPDRFSLFFAFSPPHCTIVENFCCFGKTSSNSSYASLLGCDSSRCCASSRPFAEVTWVWNSLFWSYSLEGANAGLEELCELKSEKAFKNLMDRGSELYRLEDFGQEDQNLSQWLLTWFYQVSSRLKMNSSSKSFTFLSLPFLREVTIILERSWVADWLESRVVHQNKINFIIEPQTHIDKSLIILSRVFGNFILFERVLLYLKKLSHCWYIIIKS